MCIRDRIRVFNRDEEMTREFDARNNDVYDASFKAQALSGAMMPAMQFVQYLTYVLIAVGGALRVTAGQMTLGDVTAFIQYSREFAQPIGEMAGMANMLQSGVASAERTFELLDAEEQSPDQGTQDDASRRAPHDPSSSSSSDTDHLPEQTSGHVEFEHVAFSYDEDQPLIEDLSLEVQPGQTVAIVGPTGAGKTCLLYTSRCV